MATHSGMPTKNPAGGSLTIDQIQLHRLQPRDYKVIDSLMSTIDLIKAKPAESIGGFALLFGAYFVIYLVFYVAFIVVMMATGAASAALQEVSPVLAQVVMFGVMGVGYLIFFAFIMVLQSIVLAAYFILGLRIVRNQPVELQNIMDVKLFIKPMVITALLFSFAVMAGAIMLVIPAYIIMLGCYFSQVLVVDKNIQGVEALKASWRLTDGHKLPLLGYFFVAGVVNMIGMIPCGLGMFVTMPMFLLGMLMIYDALAEPGNAYVQETHATDVFV